MIKSFNDAAILYNGKRMPRLGLGTYKTRDGAEVVRAVRTALDIGYRSIDTAFFYDNEAGIGKAVEESGISRSDVFIATKLWNTEHGYDEAFRAFDRSRKRLRTDYIDLYIIHWPVRDVFPDTWRAMEELYDRGLVGAIGVSNFNVRHLVELRRTWRIKPMVNQFELHPRLVQKDIIQYCESNSIQVESWAPLMRGMLNGDPVITSIAAGYGKTSPQVLIRWGLQHGFVIIPKSVNPERILENSLVFDFTLSKSDMDSIDTMNRMERTGPDPDTFV